MKKKGRPDYKKAGWGSPQRESIERFRRFQDLCEASQENPYPHLALPPSVHETQNEALKRELKKALPAIIGQQSVRSGGSKGGKSKSENQGPRLETRNAKIIQFARSCRQTHSLKEFLDLAVPKGFDIGRRQLREIVSSVYPKKKRRPQP